MTTAQPGHSCCSRPAPVASVLSCCPPPATLAASCCAPPATLAPAGVGIALGTGTDVAIESAGVTLARGDLAGIGRLRRLARAIVRNVRESLAFAFGYNALGVPVAAGVLYPLVGVLRGPMMAGAAMAPSSASVTGDTLRPGRTRP
jgi:Cu+-exporting ATPase